MFRKMIRVRGQYTVIGGERRLILFSIMNFKSL